LFGLTQPRPLLRLRTLLTSTAATLGVLFATACASSDWSEAKNLSIGYDQFESGASLMLVNRGHQQYQDLYSKPRTTSNIKLLDDEDMRALLDRFQAAGFFTWAGRADPIPPEAQKNLSGRLTIEVDGRAYAFVIYPRGNPRDKRDAFGKMVEDFRTAYDGAFALQSIENKRGAQIFAEEQERLNKQGDPKRQKP
jgi:hypothetical protein